ncbi:unnamed protein product [Diamesa hyperborea]
MSSRRAQSQQPTAYEKQMQLQQIEPPPPGRSKCMSCLCFSWKVFTCIFSHATLITLVVSYCVLGAFTFERLEADFERTVKRNIRYIRGNTSEKIWLQTGKSLILRQDNFTLETIKHLQEFENSILEAMKKNGWDGIESEDKIQWTFSGALFYSIIVITTIGYGHIAPKTLPGKISTIFYAILGIPLMLLCLSNIGDIMASSFRFLYWRVCCYVCTREPKKSQRRRMIRSAGTIRQQQLQQQQQQQIAAGPGRYSGRIPNNSMRRSIRTSQRSADSGFDTSFYDTGLSHAYSDMDCRFQLYYDEREKGRGNSMNSQRNRTQLPPSPRYGGGIAPGAGGRNSYRGDRHTVDRERFPKYNEPDEYLDEEHEPQMHVPRRDRMRDNNMPPTPLQNQRHLMRHSEDRQMNGSPNVRQQNRGGAALRVHSLDRRMLRRDPVMIDFEQEPPCKTPVLCNKYAMDDLDERGMTRDAKRSPNIRSQSMPRQSGRYGDRLTPAGRADNRSVYDENDIEMQPIRNKGRKRERPVPSPSPRIMSPMGFAINRQARHVATIMDDTSLYDDDWDRSSGDGPPSSFIRPVPIWLCVFLVVSYIIGGAFLFSKWENWSFLDSAYFCFITLSFGDFVPAQSEKDIPEVSIGLCSLYLLFGIALLAMSFNLVQEEVINNVKSVAKRLGIIKDDEIEE